MTRGIYAYIDKETNKIVYAGKDSQLIYLYQKKVKDRSLLWRKI